jgi:cellulose synthase/poly-beta-1,6-N-acetylglucosamine synthase-like glycosyltransferase
MRNCSGPAAGAGGPTSIHHRLRDEKRAYRIRFVPEPCSWTMVPSRYKVLAHQRARWSQILCEALWIHKVMLFDPRYGGVGLVVLPFYLIFELLGAVVEALAIIVFIVVGLGYATLLTLSVLGRQAGWVAPQAKPEPSEAWPGDLPADR